ncbi:MAG: uroporphyrinogen-III C-methyltransferase [Lachnospiraceae bacterium]|nr:uroporphyrinogen-III C-methyltransferase [Lachnospiraceae bacterium]
MSKGEERELKTGKVYLTGGGCGDPGLLTLKALEVLRGCDVVIYDSLVSEELLELTRPDCEKIYVGKRYGSHVMKQPEINALLVKKAGEGKTVVRLKGGDPYVFGRGGEEFLALREAGICCEEIPGVTSAIAVPAAAGIPVTHRGLSAGVTVVTGTAAEKDGQDRLQMDFETLARLDGTLVILMGMHHLQEIADGLMIAGKDPDTPCAVIMEGTTDRQRCIRTVLSQVYKESSKQGFKSPAVIVIGAVAELELLSEKDGESELQQILKRKDEQTNKLIKPLDGITVGATGTSHFVQKLSAALTGRGADVWDMGFMEIRPSESPLPDLEACGWLVFTSPNGVRVFLDKMKQERKDLRILYGKRIAVIGPGTAAVLEETGIYADCMPEIYDAVHLAEGLTEKILDEQRDGHKDKTQAVFLRAAQGSASLPLIFTEKGIPFADYPIYELEIQKEKRIASIAKEPDYIVFGSAMGVKAYFEGMEQAGLVNTRSRYVCIGELCGEELKKHTESYFLTARESSVDSIVECLCEYIATAET